MLKDPSALRIGLMFAAAWAIWFGGGLAYAASSRSITSFLVNLPKNRRILFFIGVVILSALFGQAVYRIKLGMSG